MIRTTVYEYGCGDERYGGYDGVAITVEQIRLANRLWNALVEIDRYQRTEYRKLTADPTIQGLIEAREQEKETLYAAVKRQKQLERKKNVKIDPAITLQLRRVREDLKVLYARRKAECARLKIQNAQAIDTLNKEIEIKTAAATDPKQCGLNWAMIEPLKVRFKTAKAQAKKKGTLLKFQRFDGSGRLTVPFTNGLSLADTQQAGEKGKFQIGTALMTAHPREKRTLCRIAVAAVNKKPIWLTLPVVFHRPLPLEADIRSVAVQRDMLAGKPRWKMCITVRLGAARKSVNPSAVAIDIGWRKRTDGSLRVAYWCDTNCRQGELVLSADDMQQFHKLDDLRSIMDVRFNDVRQKLEKGLQGIAIATTVPQPLADLFQFISKWKSPGRLIHAMRAWEQNRFPGDTQLWDATQLWYHGPKLKPDPDWNGHKHLHLWFVNLRDQLQRKRREQYRVFAARLTKAYGKVFVENFDLQTVTKKRPPDKDVVHDAEARYQRTKAAISVLRLAVENACARDGVDLEKVDPAYTSHHCPACGALIDFDARNVSCKCESCGGAFDQDYVGAKNILDRGARLGSGK
jgi:hypothetical protein